MDKHRGRVPERGDTVVGGAAMTGWRVGRSLFRGLLPLRRERGIRDVVARERWACRGGHNLCPRELRHLKSVNVVRKDVRECR